jgi:hypothetical protein
MRARAQDDLDQCRSVVADHGGLSQDPLVRPVAVAPVRARHVVGERGRPIRAVAAQMGRDQFAAVEDLHRLRRDAGFDLFAEQPERHRVEVLGDLDVVVEVPPTALPVGIFRGRRWQLPQGGPIDLLVERASGGTPAAHRSVVELNDQLTDRLVQFGQREEPTVAQPRQDPALHHLNASTFALSRGLYGRAGITAVP